MSESTLLGATEIRALAESLSAKPTKKLGQNFVIDPNTVRRIVAQAHVSSEDVVVEIGPGLGSLTLALLPNVAKVLAVEIDPVLSTALPATISKHAPNLKENLIVINADAMRIDELPINPTHLVANLPYNVSVPVVLHFLETFPSLKEILVMVQAEVADRMAAGPGSKIYGVPSVKMAWYGDVTKAGSVGRNVFWPAPNVDSGLVRLVRKDREFDPQLRELTFAIVDAAFGQRRKTLRTALGSVLGSPQTVESILQDTGIDSGLRGEQLSLKDFVAIAKQAKKVT
ncbi:MAG: 16S rRNA (adenine(1518)-N(6)/adenine(1519)-N(6))-dimethyltransferase RsmA [Actinobacteria bacterium]|jgi:16S rRNA (adenine1518-N6/adenine1519-N6)-dimethyltransferase|nr:16S rRNA (adenine(1518)-N(6)/adenine(1519)-N(6))-dimethyltransferase RsmA [Actinomycetota bacterium]NBO34432.1 16S rRNA (adenine(1518)-N(6)/adenine(1519)-N(6))-dimethyltransferase RsmA [Actinomycetota bacterium]